ESVQRSLEEPQRRAYHRELARALEAASTQTFASLRMLVTHLAEAGELERAGQHAARAADMAAEALAFDQAAELYRMALQLLPSRAPREQQRLWVALARSLDYAARGADAARAYLKAAAGAQGQERRELRRKAAELLLASGHLDEGLTAVDDMLGEFGARLPATRQAALAALRWQRMLLRVRGLRYRAKSEAEISREALDRIDTFYAVQVGLTAVDNLRAFAFQTRGFRMALDAGEELRIGRGMALEGLNRATLGLSRQKEALDLISRARRIGEARGDAYVTSLSISCEGMALYLGGQFREGAARIAEGERMQRERLRHTSAAVAKELGAARVLKLQALRMQGDFQEMDRSALEYQRDAEARGDLFAEVSFLRGAAFRHLVADAPERALEDLTAKVWPPPHGHFHTQHWYSLRIRAEVALYGGEPNGRAFLAEEFFAMNRSALPEMQVLRAEAVWLWARLCLLEAASIPDQRAAALREVREAVRSLEAEKVPYASGLAALVRGCLGSVTGDRAGAVKELARAREALADQMGLCAAAAAYRLEQLAGGGPKEGEAMLRALGVRQPARMADVVVPGDFGRG
ncbi:MAG TPA: hypothetical protein VND93_31845, partial [Myxococcales bacterium]|nr:hypothetical protein [Myxococcales bacterium]